MNGTTSVRRVIPLISLDHPGRWNLPGFSGLSRNGSSKPAL
jgi:hypothetical protein